MGFQVTKIHLGTELAEIEQAGQKRHQEVLALIEALSDSSSSYTASSVRVPNLMRMINDSFIG